MSPQTLQTLFDDFNRHDIDKVMESFDDECVFDTHTDQKIVGKEQVRAAFVNAFETFPDAHWELEDQHHSADNIINTEWTFTGTDKEGNRTEVRGTDIFTLRGDMILIKNAFRKYVG